MKKVNLGLEYEPMSAEEVDSFLDEALSELLDNDTITSDTDKIPNLALHPPTES